jgi:hypothetical protein
MSSNGKGFKPIKVEPRMSDERIDELIWEKIAEKDRRLNALADSRGIPNDHTRWYRMAMDLAERHEPELMTSRPEGARVKWHLVAQVVLINLVAWLMNKEGLTKAKACDRLAADDPWLSKFKGKSNGDALARQCSSNWLKMTRNHQATVEKEGELECYMEGMYELRRVLMKEQK